MTEQAYQKKIIDAIIADGGHAFTGQFPKGEADIVGMWGTTKSFIQIEVKTEYDYNRVMKCLIELDKQYEIIDLKGLKPHEPLQVAKMNALRRLGGKGLFAFEYKQVVAYMNGEYT